MRHIKQVVSLSLSLPLLLVLGAAGAAAQDVNVHLGGADPVLRGAAAAAAGTSLDQGDVDGDGRRDLIVGAPGTGGVGQVSIFFTFAGDAGTIDLTPANADATITGNINGANFGTAIASGLILNSATSDAARNLVVGAPGIPGSAGIVYIFAGPITRGSYSATTARFIIVGGAGEQFGSSVATADLNGDGFREVIVGARGSSRVYVFNLVGRTAGTLSSATANMTIVEDAELVGGGLGEVIESAGDITGDGTYDLAIGMPRAYGTRGAVYIVRGHTAAEGITFPGTITLINASNGVFKGTDVGDRAGQSLAYKDVVFADTTSTRDLVIGAPGADGVGNARTDSGEVYIIWGGNLVPGCAVHSVQCTRQLSAPFAYGR